jgi:DNA polymerase III delta prime subunit
LFDSKAIAENAKMNCYWSITLRERLQKKTNEMMCFIKQSNTSLNWKLRILEHEIHAIINDIESRKTSESQSKDLNYKIFSERKTNTTIKYIKENAKAAVRNIALQMLMKKARKLWENYISVLKITVKIEKKCKDFINNYKNQAIQEFKVINSSFYEWYEGNFDKIVKFSEQRA